MKPLAQNTLIQNRYLIVHLIGKGGMGEVYLAVDQRLGSAVALKRTFFAGDEMLSNAFEREARILARMRHPVLPKVSDHFSEGEEQYLVMEHISGDDLAKRLEAAQKPFPLSWVMFWADQLLDALSYLHSHEPPIIHRDIKPQNLKLTDENHVILLDFGLSKNSAAPKANSDSGSSSASNTASVVGYTPHYAPMEQIRGIGTSPRSDLYSLSATLYQLLTNVVPPDALSRADTILNGAADPIESPSSHNPEIPPPVSVVLLKGMEVSQDKRYESAREMQKALRKAYAQMQDVMAAQTVVMSAEGTSVADSVPVEAPSMDKTEVMDFAAVPLAIAANEVAGAISAAEAPTNIISQPSPPAVDPNATMFDGGGNQSVPLQADVKTEVFLAGSGSMPTPPYQEPASPVVESGQPYAETEDFAVETNNGSNDFDVSAAPADATMPIIAFDQAIDSAPASEDTNYYGTPYASEASSPSGFEAAAATADSIPSEAVQPSYAAAAPAKKRSGGKVLAVVGGLFALLVLGVAALGGGWYYYANYYSAAVEPVPSPSASPSVEPTAEPTVDQANSSVTDNNSNTTASTDEESNSNSNSSDLTVAPTPAPTPGTVSTPSDTVSTRPTPGVTTKATPAKTTTKPVAKSTPKPTSTRDRKVILQ